MSPGEAARMSSKPRTKKQRTRRTPTCKGCSHSSEAGPTFPRRQALAKQTKSSLSRWPGGQGVSWGRRSAGPGGYDLLRPALISSFNIHTARFPSWPTGKASTCQWWRLRFEPWSGKIPPASEQRIPRTTATEPVPWSPGAVP